MRRRIDQRLLPSSVQPQNRVVANEAFATPLTDLKFDERLELEQVNVLYSFLENRYAKKVPDRAPFLVRTCLDFASKTRVFYTVSSIEPPHETCVKPYVL